MAQALLPMIPAGATPLTEVLSVVREGGQWTYFCGVEPVYGHPEADLASFRMFTAQLIHLGQCRPVDIIRTFGVSKNSVLRSVAKYEAGGSGSFFRRRAGRGATVLTPAVTLRAEALLAACCARCRRCQPMDCSSTCRSCPSCPATTGRCR